MRAIVLVDHGSRRKEANEAFLEVAARYAERSGHPIVEPAHMELAPPTIAEAFANAVEQGATEIVVHPYFLFHGRHCSEDIPRMCAEAAAAHPGLRWRLTAPLGLADGILEVVDERIRQAVDGSGTGAERSGGPESKEDRG